MRLLLDTHAFLWYVLDDEKLGGAARGAINDSANDVFVSPASYWEIAIKISIGKYELTTPFEAFWDRAVVSNHFQILPIEIKHAAAVAKLPFHHKDPFDRLLVAQAIVENLTGDIAFDAYPIMRVW